MDDGDDDDDDDAGDDDDDDTQASTPFPTSTDEVEQTKSKVNDCQMYVGGR